MRYLVRSELVFVADVDYRDALYGQPVFALTLAIFEPIVVDMQASLVKICEVVSVALHLEVLLSQRESRVAKEAGVSFDLTIGRLNLQNAPGQLFSLDGAKDVTITPEIDLSSRLALLNELAAEGNQTSLTGLAIAAVAGDKPI